MNVYADIFCKTFNPDVVNESITSDNLLDRLNVIIFGLKNTTLIPYILYIMKNVEDELQRAEMFNILESYIMRRLITRDSSKSYKGVFNSLIAKQVNTPESLWAALKSDGDTTTRFPTDAEAIEAVENESRISNLAAKGILYFLETRIRPENCGTSTLGFNAYSLEHLMPKNWRNNWDIPESEDEQKERDRKLLTLGNLAIITPSLNSKIRDAAWNRKLEGNNKNSGLNACSSGLSTFEGVLDKDIWNEAEITKRSEWLANKAIEAWPYPEESA